MLACSKLDWLHLSHFGHNLHLAVLNAVNDSQCTSAISVCKKIVSAFSKSWKKRRDLAQAQRDLKLKNEVYDEDEPFPLLSPGQKVKRELGTYLSHGG